MKTITTDNSNKKAINFRDRNLVFVDLETTGLDSEKHEIIEVAILVVEPRTFQVITEYVTKVKPQHMKTADPVALNMGVYNEEGWEDAKDLKTVMNEINKLSEDGMFSGWNVVFDYSFLSKAFNDLSIMPLCDYHVVDVMSIAFSRLYFKKDPQGLSLRKVAPVLGVDLDEKHGAFKDIEATYKIFKKLMDKNGK